MKTHNGRIVASNDSLSVIHCAQCGFAHLDPLPLPQEVTTYYTKDRFYQSGASDWFQKEEAEYKAGLWHSAYRFQAQLLRRGEWCWPRVVDIGSGPGWFIRYYRDGGGPAYGVEPSESARLASPLKTLLYSGLDKIPRVRSRTDSARMVLVLEHVYDPLVEVLKVRNAVIGHSGQLLLIVPNETNLLQQLVQKQVGYPWWVQKVHLNYFTKDTIRNLLRACGFRITYQGGTFPMELFYLAGFRYVGNDQVGRKVHRWRLVFEKRMGPNVFRFYHMLYNVLGWGRETIIVGEA